jgi:hypothetical protein
MEKPRIAVKENRPARNEWLIIAALCIAADVRVFIFSAAFPFFNNVDEQSHFDLVYKYSRGHLPLVPLEKFDSATAKIIGDNTSPEYLRDSSYYIGPNERKAIASGYEKLYNLDAWAWPSYYILAGLWFRLGQIFGLGGGVLLYWIRFLNIPIITAFVWLSYLFSRKYLPDDRQRIAIPLLIAFFPQDIFFAITADVFSPLVFAAAFFMLLGIYSDDKSQRYHLFAGLIVAVTLLNKATNVAIAALAAVVVLIKLKQAVSQKRLKQYLPSSAAFILACAVPVAFWLGRNYVLFGDLSGAAASLKSRTWTEKPLSETFDHPILTLKGAFVFLTELIKSFWRGEFVWALKRICSPIMDWFYCLSSVVLLLAAFCGFVVNKQKINPDASVAVRAGTGQPGYRFCIAASFLVVLLSVLLLAILSMRYDFGRCFYPSRDFPFFASGRLIAGTILPFLFLYVDGLYRILLRLRLGSYLLIVVICIVAAITISEIFISLPAFASPYNFFHLK